MPVTALGECGHDSEGGDTVPILVGEQTDNKKHADPSVKKFICCISSPMIFQLPLMRQFFLLLSFCSPLSLPGELGWANEEICDEVLSVTRTGTRGTLAEEATSRAPEPDTPPPTLWLLVSSSWQIIKISQQENWLGLFKVPYNYNAWYLGCLLFQALSAQ